MKYFILICFLFSSLIANSQENILGDKVNNGGGLAEKNLLMAYNYLERYLQICTNAQVCRIDSRERKLLEKINKSLPQEYANKNQIIFASERENPGFFIIDGELKVAKTGDEVGSNIYINRDLIYQTLASNNQLQPLSLPDMLAILIHELGHHHGEFDHDFLDILGVKVAFVVQQHTSVTTLLPFDRQLSVTVINEVSEKSFPIVLLNVFDQVIDATQAFKEAQVCNYNRLPLPIVDKIFVKTEKPFGVLFHNLHWVKFATNEEDSQILLEGNTSKFCSGRSSFGNSDTDYKTEISFNITPILEKDSIASWKYSENSLQINEKYDPWWRIIRWPF